MLWDKQIKRIVSNSDDDLLRMFNSEFSGFAARDHDFHPVDQASEIDTLNKLIYKRVNNGEYRVGFATRQRPYELAARTPFRHAG